jgi:putative transposase
MARGFVCPAAVLDWYSRRVLSWRLSKSLRADFCVEALEEAVARYGAPEIINTDQGSQLPAARFIGVLQRHKLQIGVDGRARWRDAARSLLSLHFAWPDAVPVAAARPRIPRILRW